jgi:F-type H+-transporting ATPase subunit delta
VRSESIALNYAEALFALGEKSGQAREYADLLDGLAGGIAASPTVQAVLASPKVPKPVKSRILTGAMAEAPEEFRLFLAAVVKRNRQILLGQIATAYLGLLDLKLNRVRPTVTVAREPDEAFRALIKTELEARLKKEVIPVFVIDPEILGGVVIRLGDRLLDASVRRRLVRLRRQLLRS